MVNIPLFTGFYTSQVVQDFFHQQHVSLLESTSWESLNIPAGSNRRVAIFSVSPEAVEIDPMFPPPIRKKKTTGEASHLNTEKKNVWFYRFFLCFFCFHIGEWWKTDYTLVTCLTSESFKSKIDAFLDFPIHGFTVGHLWGFSLASVFPDLFLLLKLPLPLLRHLWWHPLQIVSNVWWDILEHSKYPSLHWIFHNAWFVHNTPNHLEPALHDSQIVPGNVTNSLPVKQAERTWIQWRDPLRYELVMTSRPWLRICDVNLHLPSLRR